MLVLMRHAKSAYPPDIPDYDRPLSERGRRNAASARMWLIDHDAVPAHAIVSSAQRTRETWAILDFNERCRVEFRPELYLADAATIVALAQTRARGETTLMLGHNPGMHEAAEQLGGSVIDRFPTSALAVCDEQGLRDFVVPR
jgi:phosphohistidine phosphatase